jgi:hypothetical protein
MITKEWKGFGVVVVLVSVLAASVIPLVMASPPPSPGPNVAQISCTVTTATITVNVDPSYVDYDVVGTGKNKSSGTIYANNTGTVSEDFTIRGDNATGGDGPTTWVLADSVDTDQYKHAFTPDGGTETTLATEEKPLANDVAAEGTQTFILTLYTPNVITDPGYYSTEVMVIATEA